MDIYMLDYLKNKALKSNLMVEMTERIVYYYI